jgi:hypothetical protein
VALEARTALLAGERQRLEHGEDVPLDGEVPEDRRLLGQVAHPEAGAAVHGEPVDALTLEEHLARVGADHADGHAERRRLAGAVRTEEADDLSRLDGERDAVDDGASPPERLDEALGFEEGHGGKLPQPPFRSALRNARHAHRGGAESAEGRGGKSGGTAIARRRTSPSPPPSPFSADLRGPPRTSASPRWMLAVRRMASGQRVKT